MSQVLTSWMDIPGGVFAGTSASPTPMSEALMSMTFRSSVSIIEHLRNGFFLELSFQTCNLPRMDLLGGCDPFVVLLRRCSLNGWHTGRVSLEGKTTMVPGTQQSSSLAQSSNVTLSPGSVGSPVANMSPAYQMPGKEYRPEELIRTETIGSEQDNARFVTKYKRQFANGEPIEDEYEIQVFDRDCKSENLNKHDFIGSAMFRLSQLICVAQQTLNLPLTNSKSTRAKHLGEVIIRAHAVPNTPVELVSTKYAFMINLTPRKSSHGYYIFVVSRSTDNVNFVPLYRSSLIHHSQCKLTTNHISLADLSLGDPNSSIRIEVNRKSSVLRSRIKPLGYAQVNSEVLITKAPPTKIAWFPVISGEDFLVEHVTKDATERTFGITFESAQI